MSFDGRILPSYFYTDFEQPPACLQVALVYPSFSITSPLVPSAESNPLVPAARLDPYVYKDLDLNGILNLSQSEQFTILRTERARLATFPTPWTPPRQGDTEQPQDYVTPQELAADGFYYTLPTDVKSGSSGSESEPLSPSSVKHTVKCIFCRVVLSDWLPGAVAHQRHKEASKTCVFVVAREKGDRTGAACGNVPIDCSDVRWEAQFAAKKDATDESDKDGSWKRWRPFCATRVSAADRKATFSSWPVKSGPSGYAMAHAGWYYPGYKDTVRCYSCGGGLANWSEEDPVETHIKYFPHCGFLWKVLEIPGERMKKIVDANKGTLDLSRVTCPGRKFDSEDIRKFLEPSIKLESYPQVKLLLKFGMSIGDIRKTLERFFPNYRTEMPKASKVLDAAFTLQDGQKPGDRGSLDSVYRSGITDGGRSDLPSVSDLTGAVAGLAAPPTNGRQNGVTGGGETTGQSGPPAVPNDRQNGSSSGSGASGGEDLTLPAPAVGAAGGAGMRPRLPGIGAAGGSAFLEKHGPTPDEMAELLNRIDVPRLVNTGLRGWPGVSERVRPLWERALALRLLACQVCLAQPAEIILLPCGHFSSCSSCAPTLESCPVCSGRVMGTARTRLT